MVKVVIRFSGCEESEEVVPASGDLKGSTRQRSGRSVVRVRAKGVYRRAIERINSPRRYRVEDQSSERES